MAPAVIPRSPDYISRLLAASRIDEDIDRLGEARERWLAWIGRKDNVLEVAEGDPDDNILVPYEQLVVNKSRSFLFGKGDIKFEIETPDADTAGDQTQAGESVMQTHLDNVWRRNWKKTFLLKLATNGGVFGHCYIKILNEAPLPRLINLDPATVDVTWDEEDIDKVMAYEIITNRTDDDGNEVVHKEVIEREELGEDEGQEDILTTAAAAASRQTGPGVTSAAADAGATPERPAGAPDPPDPAINLALVPQQLVQWKVNHYEAGHDDDDWIRVAPEAIWPYPWPPVIDCQNVPVPNEYYGISDLEPAVLSLIKGVDRLLSNMNRIIRFHGHPFLYTVGLTTQEAQQIELSLDPDSITNIPNPDGDLRSLEMQSDLASSIEVFKRVKELVHEVTRIPEIATGKVENVGPMSGVALEILYGPLQELTEDKRCTYGDMLHELNRRLLDLAGFGPDNWVNNVWPETIPKDLEAEGRVLNQDKALGASERTLLAKRGYDPDKEAKQRQEEAERNMQLNMQGQQAQLAITGQTDQDVQQDARQEQQREATRGSTPGSTQFGRNATR